MRPLETLVVVMVLLSGCGPEPRAPSPLYGQTPAGNGPQYAFAVHPLYNPAKLLKAYQPLIAYLNENLDVRFDLEASRDYAAFEAKYTQGGPAVLLPNPWQTLQAQKTGYQVVAMAGDPADFRGILLVRRDSGIRVPRDLRGKAVSYPSATALAACILPQYYLFTQGIDVNTEIENRYVGSQESSILNVVLGKTAAGATWPPPWRFFQQENPELAAQLTVLGETEPLVNNSVMVRSDFPGDLRDKLQTLLIGLSGSDRGRAILAGMETAGFFSASDRDYAVVQRFVARFEREVRAVVSP